MNTSSAIQKAGTRPAERLLRLVVAWEALFYFFAAALHLGLRVPLGPVVLAVPDVIFPAAIVETILGLVVAANLIALLRGSHRARGITLAAHGVALVGVLIGMAALALRVGPPPSPHWTLHYVMLAGIAAALVLVSRKPN
jgi:hypothetical protein